MKIERLTRGLLLPIAVGVAVTLAPGAVLAHADLVAADPPAVEAKPAPTELRLSFSEKIELAFSKVKVTNATQQEAEIGPLSLDPADDKVLVVPLRTPLAGGFYTVEWSVVSADGHKLSGSYAIAVAP